MALRVMIFGVNRIRKRGYRVQNRLGECMRARGLRKGFGAFGFRGAERFRELAQALVNLFERFGTGREEALERNAEISFEDVALPLFRFIGIEMIGSGNGVAALVF